MKRFGIYSFLYIVLFGLFTILSYSLTDPNLVLSSNQLYWNFQTLMWQKVFNNAQYQGNLFFVLFALLSITYFLLLNKSDLVAKSKNTWLLLTLMGVLLFTSYNALSHDIFNYIFNAKMVIKYSLDPHTHTALEITTDDWLRFMHNTHTTAPYGYGWTGLSLIPSFLGFNTFLLTYVLFKGWALLSYIALVLWVYYSKKSNELILLLNPLLLIEVISSGHNDLFMMVPAMMSIWLMSQKRKGHYLLLAAALLLASISIKFATLLLLPLFILLYVNNYTNYFKKLLSFIQPNVYWPLIASISLFAPLLTERSQQFHPWYLIWSFVWIVYFPKNTSNFLYRSWQACLLILSISSLFRYLPWIYAGGFPSYVLMQQKMITWIPMILCFVCMFAILLKEKYQKNEK